MKSKDEYNRYMNSYMKNRYKERRDSALERLGGCCAECGTKENLEVDHIAPSEKTFNLAMGKIAESLPLCGLLQGHKVLVYGNHDRMFRPKNDNQFQRWMTEYSQYFESIVPEMVWNDRLLFNHFPYSGDSHDEDRYLSSRPKKSNLWLCHGHTHQKEFLSGERSVHVGVDAEVANYAPIPIEKVLELTGS